MPATWRSVPERLGSGSVGAYDANLRAVAPTLVTSPLRAGQEPELQFLDAA